MNTLLTEQEKQAALRAAAKEKIASMSDEEVNTFVAQADAEKTAAAVAANAQAGGRVTYHGYKEAMQRYEELLEEHGNDKVAALQALIPEVAVLDQAYAELAGGELPKTASDADSFSEADAKGLAKIAQDESLPETARKIAHETLVRHGYELVEVAA